MSPKEVDRRPSAKLAPVDVEHLPELQLDDIQDEATELLQARGAAYAREYARIEGKATVLLQNVATVTVALRSKHDDWLGRTHEYRQDVAEMYRLANIPSDSQSRIQSAVRWHVGNVLRRVLTPRELKVLELKDTSPAERQQDRRATNAVLLRTVTATAELESSAPARQRGPKGKGVVDASRVPEQGGHPVKATADHIRLASTGLAVFRQLDTGVIDEHMTDGQRAKLDQELEALQKLVAKLRRHTKKRRSEGK